MKNLRTILITLCTLAFAQTTFAGNEPPLVNKDGISYALCDDYTAVLNSGMSVSGSVILPSTITYNEKDYIITTIAEQAFLMNDGIVSITIPNSVSTIGAGAFLGCSNLQSVTIGAFVQSIGEKAFDECDQLTQVTFYPTTSPTLGNHLFSATKFTICSVNNESYRNSLDDYISPNVFKHSVDLSNYRTAVSEAITLAATRVTLSAEDDTAISGYKTAIESAMDEASVSTNELAAHKIIALAGIKQALPSDGLTAQEQAVVDGKEEAIEEATSLAAIYSPQKEALDYIVLHKARTDALAAIEEAKQGITNSMYLNNLVKEQVDAINNATDVTTINSKKQEAIKKLNAAVLVYKAALSELPTNGSTGNGVRITLGTKSLELMNPDKVEFFKVSTEE